MEDHTIIEVEIEEVEAEEATVEEEAWEKEEETFNQGVSFKIVEDLEEGVEEAGASNLAEWVIKGGINRVLVV